MIRADGRPRITMLCNLVGAVLNTILDALFVFGLNLGMSGAALATIIGQIVSGALAIGYLMHGKTVTIRRENLRIKWENVTRIASLGMAPCSNQVAMMVVQIIMNQSLKHYGSPLDLRRKYSDCVCRHYYKSKHDFYVLCHWTFAGLTADCKF